MRWMLTMGLPGRRRERPKIIFMDVMKVVGVT